MAVGYTRQSSGLIITGAIIEASHFNNEYNAIESAMNATTGHNHDGTSGGGSPIAPSSLSGLSSNGIVARTSASTFAGRTLTGTANEITVTNGTGVSGDPTLSLPTALTFTGKTVTGGTFSGVIISGTPTITVTDGALSITGSSDATKILKFEVDGFTTGTTRTITVPDISDTLVTLTATQTLTNKTLTSPIITTPTITVNDDSLSIRDNGDTSKVVQFQVSGLTTATTRTKTFQDVSGTIYESGGTDVPVTDGGTGASDASTARTNLGVAIGTDVQAYDADLTALAGVSSNGLLARTGAGSAAARTLTAPAAGITVTDGDGVSGNPTLVLANDLSALEGLSSTGIAVRSASDTWVQRTITGTTNVISVTDGNGVSGNPTLTVGSLVGRTDTAAEWTRTQNFDATTLSDGATISWDTSQNQVTSVTLGGNRTMDAPTNLKDGGFYSLTVIQDGTGSRTVTWNSVFKWPTATAPTLTTTASARDEFIFKSNGTNLYAVGQSLDVR